MVWPFVLQEIKCVVRAAELTRRTILQRHRHRNAPSQFFHFRTSSKAECRTANLPVRSENDSSLLVTVYPVDIICAAERPPATAQPSAASFEKSRLHRAVQTMPMFIGGRSTRASDIAHACAQLRPPRFFGVDQKHCRLILSVIASPRAPAFIGQAEVNRPNRLGASSPSGARCRGNGRSRNWKPESDPLSIRAEDRFYASNPKLAGATNSFHRPARAASDR